MKKTLLFAATALSLLAFASCSKSANCHCTYVGQSNSPSAGQTKEEDSKVSNKVGVDSYGQCSNLEDKYFQADFSGTCTIQ